MNRRRLNSPLSVSLSSSSPVAVFQVSSRQSGLVRVCLLSLPRAATNRPSPLIDRKLRWLRLPAGRVKVRREPCGSQTSNSVTSRELAEGQYAVPETAPPATRCPAAVSGLRFTPQVSLVGAVYRHGARGDLDELRLAAARHRRPGARPEP